jgi:hypothetical protein
LIKLRPRDEQALARFWQWSEINIVAACVCIIDSIEAARHSNAAAREVVGKLHGAATWREGAQRVLVAQACRRVGHKMCKVSIAL